MDAPPLVSVAPGDSAFLAPWRNRQVEPVNPLDTRPPSAATAGLFWGADFNADASLKSLHLAKCVGDEDLYPRFTRLPLIYNDGAGSTLYHYADLAGALACFRIAYTLAHDAPQIALLDANDPTDDSHEGRLWVLRQWDYMASIVYWIAAGFNLLNLPWYLDGSEDPTALNSRNLYRKWLAGPNTDPQRAYSQAGNSDYNPWFWLHHDDLVDVGQGQQVNAADVVYSPSRQRPAFKPPYGRNGQAGPRDNTAGALAKRAVALMQKFDQGGMAYADRILFRQQVGMLLRPLDGTHDNHGWRMPWYELNVENEGYVVPRLFGYSASVVDSARIDDPTGQNRASGDGRQWRSKSGSMKNLAVFAVGQGFMLADPWRLQWIGGIDPSGINQQVLDYKLPSALLRRWWNWGSPLFDDGAFLITDWRVTTGDWGMGENIAIPLRDYLPWLVEWTEALVARPVSQIVQSARQFSADENAAKVRASNGMSQFLTDAGSTPAQIQTQWNTADPGIALALTTTGTVAAAAGAALSSSTMGISALVGGVIAAVTALAGAVGNRQQFVEGKSLDDLGRWKPLIERSMLVGDWTVPNYPMNDAFRSLPLPPGFCRAFAQSLVDQSAVGGQAVAAVAARNPALAIMNSVLLPSVPILPGTPLTPVAPGTPGATAAPGTSPLQGFQGGVVGVGVAAPPPSNALPAPPPPARSGKGWWLLGAGVVGAGLGVLAALLGGGDEAR